jgi:hypothetical protein
MDDSGEDLVDPVTVDAGYVYNPRAWTTSENHGNQCSQHGGYCYLCSNVRKPRKAAVADGGGEAVDYTEGPDESVAFDNDLPDENRDWVAIIESVVDTLVAEGKERPVIVCTIHQLYNRKLRHKTRYCDFKTGMVVDAPDWTRELIDAHITYCGKWPELVDSTVEHTIHSVLDRQSRFMLDRSTGMVIPERVSEWIKTGEFYIKWKLCQDKCRKVTRGGAGKTTSIVGRRQQQQQSTITHK